MKYIIKISDKEVNDVAKIISKAFISGNKLLICGNGGSFADSQHFAGEMCCTYLKKDRIGFPAIALGTNNSISSAWANDNSYETAFAREIEALGRTGDVFVGISTSGKSKNVILALEKAKKSGIYTILITGSNKSNIVFNCDKIIKLKETETPRIQENTIFFIHQICKRIEEIMN